VSLVLEHGGQVVDRFEASALQEVAGYDGATATDLVDQVFRSPKLAAFTHAMRNPKSREHLAASALRLALAPVPCTGPGGTANPEPPSTDHDPAPASPPLPLVPSPSPGTAPFFPGASQPNAYAFVVGIEDYKNGPRSKGARADAVRFAELAHGTLGLPEKNIKLALEDKADHLAFDMTTEWLNLNVPRGGRIYFYFAGLGGVRRQVEYLVSYDADPHALDKTAVSLPMLLQGFAQTRAKDVIAIVDAGFSGAGGRSMPTGEGKPPGQISDPEVPPRVVLVAAVTSAEIASTVEGAGGVFTRYLMDALGTGRADIDGDGRVTLQELMAWVGPRVARHVRRDKRTQTPAVYVGPGTGPVGQVVLASGLPTP
jgi:hypothetical protein